MEKKKTNNQLRLYFSYIKQLNTLDKVKIQVADKDWIGRLRGLKNPRYLLKVLDLELPQRNEAFPNKSPNKNEFCDANMSDLTHHISWLREIVFDNGLVPYNDRNLYD